MSNKTTKILFGIFIFALVLRLIGITNSFPFIFHSDEPTIIKSALALRFYKNPGHFDWPHLYIYLNYSIYMVFAKLRDILTTLNFKDAVYFYFPIFWNDNIVFYFITRIITAVFGAAIIFPVYGGVKNLYNSKTGLIGAFAVSIMPIHIWYSHYALADVPMLFFAAVAFYFCTRILFVNSTMNYIMAGFFIGLSASTKYNGVLMAVPLLIAHVFRVLSEKEEKLIRFDNIENLIYSGVFCVFAFFIGTPYALLDFDTFIRTDSPKGALWQFVNVGSVGFSRRIKNFIDLFLIQFNIDVGGIFVVLFIASIIFIIIKFVKSKKIFEYKDLLFLISSTIILTFYMCGAEKIRSHYFIIVHLLLIITAVSFLHILFEFSKFKYSNLVVSLIFVVPLIMGMRVSYIFYREDTRVQFFKWLSTSFTRNINIYYEGSDLTPILEGSGYEFQKYKFDGIIPTNSILVVANGRRDDLNLIKIFDNNLRKGPDINVYEFYN